MIEESVVILAVSFLLAFFTETMVEYFVGTPMDHIEKAKPYRWLLMYVAAGVGLFFSLFYKLDLVALTAQLAERMTGVGSLLTQPTTPGMIVSGLAIGRGANFLSDLVARYILPKKG